MIDIRVNIEGKIVPAPGMIFICNLEKGKRVTKGGLEIPHDENMGVYDKNTNIHRGIRPRWAMIAGVAEDLKDLFTQGEFVFIRHGFWSTIMKLNINGEDFDLQVIIPKNVKEGILTVSNDLPKELEQCVEYNKITHETLQKCFN